MSRQLDLFGRPVPEVARRGPGRPPMPRATPEEILSGEAEEVLAAVRRPVMNQGAVNAQLLQRVTELEERLSSAAQRPAVPLMDEGATAQGAGGGEAPQLSEGHDPYKTPEKREKHESIKTPGTSPPGEYGVRGGRPHSKTLFLSPEHEALLRSDLPEAAKGCVVSKYREVGRRAKHYMCSHIENVLSNVPDEDTVLRAVKDYTGRSMKWVRDTWKRRELWKGTCDDAEVGRGSRGSLLKHGHSRKNRKMKASTGMRARGGGRKNEFVEIYEGVKAWLENERSHGRFVDKADLFFEFEARTEAQLQAYDARVKAGDKLSVAEKKTKVAAEKALDSVSSENPLSTKNREYRSKEIMRFAEARILKPQRLVSLTAAEEKRRAQATWRAFDTKIHAVSFGDEATLSEHGIGNPAQFIENRHECVMTFSDQVPFYCKAKSSEQVYSRHEVQSRTSKPKNPERISKSDPRTRAVRAEDLLTNVFDEDEGHGEAGDVEPGHDGQTQKRGAEHKGADKFRVTLELVHEVHHWFNKDGAEPVGRQGKALLVLAGGYAHEGNIDDNHRFIETKNFMVNGKPVVHEKGKYTGLLHTVIELRKNVLPERWAELTENLIIMQQPSGFVDKVIMKWHLELQGMRYPCSLSQRDLFTGAYCSESRRNALRKTPPGHLSPPRSSV